MPNFVKIDWSVAEIVIFNFLRQKAFENVGPIRHNEPRHAHSANVASGTVVRHLHIDVHDIDNDDNDNAWQRGPLWPHGMGPMTVVCHFGLVLLWTTLKENLVVHITVQNLQCSSFDNMNVSLFGMIGLKNLLIDWGFGAIWPPKWGAVPMQLEKGTSLCVSPHCLNHNVRYFAHKPSERICTKFGRGVEVADVLTCTNFLWSIQWLWFCKGSKINIPHWQSHSLLTQGWRNRTARELSTV